MGSVAVIDYGMGNLHSVAKALEHVAPNAQVWVTSDPQKVADADRVLLPGVGAIRDCMAAIYAQGVDKEVAQAVRSGRPFLGICVGFQALLEHSEENGGVACLGELEGRVKFFGNQLADTAGNRLKVPHMGWNQVVQTQEHPLWHGIENNSRFYFVHSYYAALTERTEVAASCEYGVNFDVAAARDNLFAVQFHPEKSHTSGLQLLKNFMHWNGQP